MNITLCVSVPNTGIHMLQMLMESARRLASGRHNITIDFTYNSEAGRVAVENAGLPFPIGHSHFVETDESGRFSARSVTHSRCINALYSKADGDVALICDYDIAFVQKDWDETMIEKIIRQGVAFFGTPYSSIDALPLLKINGHDVPMLKYQKKPNAIFLAYAPARIKEIAPRLCDFADRYGEPNDQPVRFIATTFESRCYGQPIGNFVHIDTGYRIAEMIEEHKFRWESLNRRVNNYLVLKGFPEKTISTKEYDYLYWPEEYDLGGAPFIVHFRKTTGKLTSQNPVYLSVYSAEQFFDDVRAHISRAAQAAA